MDACGIHSSEEEEDSQTLARASREVKVCWGYKEDIEETVKWEGEVGSGGEW